VPLVALLQAPESRMKGAGRGKRQKGAFAVDGLGDATFATAADAEAAAGR
jgi:hypothetical protein